MNVDTRVRTADGHIVIEDMPIGEPYAILAECVQQLCG